MSEQIKFYSGKNEEFVNIEKNENYLYFLEDTREIYKGSTRMAIGKDKIHVGSEPPTDSDVLIWIDPDGEVTKLPNGLSAYEIAVENGFEGSEEEWLESLKGDDYTLTSEDKKEIASYINDDVIQNYVIEEANRVAKQVLSHQNENSFSIFAISDTHAGLTDSYLSMTSMRQAMKLIKDKIKIDLAIHCGDHIPGNTETNEEGISEHFAVNSIFSDAWNNALPVLRTVGNHDPMLKGRNGNLSTTEIYNLIGKHNEKDAIRPMIDKDRGYCYLDLNEYKTRIICLNSTDIKSHDGYEVSNTNDIHCMSIQQLQWLSEVLLDVGQKEDWNVLVFSHHPLDYYEYNFTDYECTTEQPQDWNTNYTSYFVVNDNNVFTNVSGSSAPTWESNKYYAKGQVWEAWTRLSVPIIDAFMSKTAGSITQDGITVNFDYTNNVSNNFIGQIHGHTHSYLMGYMHENDFTSELSKNQINRLCIPNGCFGRNNEYGSSGKKNNTAAGRWGTWDTHAKTSGTAENTAFCILTVDLKNQKIYADHYGAGIDRIMPFSGQKYPVTDVKLAYKETVLESSKEVIYSRPVSADTIINIDVENTEYPIIQPKLYAIVEPANGLMQSYAGNPKVNWVSSDENVATILEDGTINIISNGTTTISVFTEDGNYTTSCVVIITNAPEVEKSLTFSTMKIDIPVDSLETQTINYTNTTGQSLNWTSSKEDVATVDQNGIVTPVGRGSTLITAMTEDGNYSTDCMIDIADGFIPVKLNEEKVTTVGYHNGYRLSEKEEAIANYFQASGSGFASGILDLRQFSKPLSLTTNINSNTSTYINGEKSYDNSVIMRYDESSLKQGVKYTRGYAVNAVIPYAGYDSKILEDQKNIQLSLYDSELMEDKNPIIAVQLCGIGKGEDVLSIDLEENIVITTIEPEVLVGITPETANIQIGETLQLETTYDPSNATPITTKWESSNSEIASITRFTGLVTGIAPGSVTITSEHLVSGQSVSCEITVLDPSEAIDVTGVSINPEILSMTVGDISTITATIIPGNATNQNIIWTSNDTNVATVDNGNVTAIGEGNTTIVATTENGNYTTECQVTVVKKSGYTDIINIADEDYFQGYRVSTSTGNLSATTTDPDYVATRIIDLSTYEKPVIIRTSGINCDASEYGQITYACFDIDGNKTYGGYLKDGNASSSGMSIAVDENNNATLTITEGNPDDINFNYLGEIQAIRLTGHGNGEDWIVTINEEITD